MPLYVDDMLSPESRQMIEEHVSSCNSCREVFRQMLEQTAGHSLSTSATTRQVTAPIKSLKKTVMKWTIAYLLAAMVMVFIYAGAMGIRLAWPVWVGFTPADENCLELEVTDAGIVAKASPETRNRYLYYIYDIQDDHLTVYLSFGTEAQQKQNMVSHGFWVKDTDWKPEPLAIQCMDDNLVSIGGTDTISGKGGAFCCLTNTRTIIFPEQTSQVYYVPDMSAELVQEFDDFMNDQQLQAMNNWEKLSLADDSYIIQTTGFDFSRLSGGIALYE